MHKFFTEAISREQARITGDDVRHAWKVLRLKAGDEVLVNDLAGTDYLGRIAAIDKTEVLVDLLEKSPTSNESPLEITVFQGLPKGQKMDLVCQKLSELGARRLVPMITHRVVPEVRHEYRKLDRLRRIALEAGKQARRSVILEVAEPVELTQLAEELNSLDLVIVPYEEMSGRGIASLEEQIRQASRIGVVVGPEGGFEPDEIQWLKERGTAIVTLGPRILRTETCALTVASILQYLAGDMAGERGGWE